METDKYYTPDISEFHLGFVLEMKAGPAKWVEFTTNTYLINEALSCYRVLETGGLPFYIFRVKYLDREDIESLGWSFIIQDKPDVMLFKKDKSYLYFLAGNERNIEIKFPEYLDADFFKGKIKNKSELATLMGWLGIK